MNKYIFESCNMINISLHQDNLLYNTLLLSDFALLENSDLCLKKKNPNRYYLDCYTYQKKRNNLSLQYYNDILKNMNCIICLETIAHNDQVYNLDCGVSEQPHIFHKICFEKWNKNSCPYCRTLL